MSYQRKVKLTVLNDLICPNCCIGQHELLSAINYCQNVLHLPLKFEIEFLPFRLISTKCLSEDMPVVSKEEFYTQKLGADKYQQMVQGISKWANEKGIPISFDGPMNQSTRAHRLSRKAYQLGGQKLQLPVLCALFKAHLEEAKNIQDFDTLATIAEETGVMSKEEALNFIKSDELEAEVNKLCDEARSKGITGVPLTVIDDKWAVTGGQSSEVFVQIFKRLAAAAMHGIFAPTPPTVDSASTTTTVC